MNRLLSQGLAIAAVLGLSGCVVAPYQALSPEQRSKIGSTEVVAGIAQREVFAQINVSNVAAATGGGLIAALIDAGINSSRTGDAETAVRPLRDALLGYDFDGEFKAQIDLALQNAVGLNAAPATISKEIGDAGFAPKVSASKADAVLLLNTGYSLSPNFEAVNVETFAFLMPRSAALRGSDAEVSSFGVDISQSIYRNRIAFSATLPNPSATLEANRSSWQADNGQMLRNSISLGAREIALTLADDINTAAGVVTASTTQLTSPFSRTREASGTLSITGTATATPAAAITVAAAPPLDAAAAPVQDALPVAAAPDAPAPAAPAAPSAPVATVAPPAPVAVAAAPLAPVAAPAAPAPVAAPAPEVAPAPPAPVVAQVAPVAVPVAAPGPRTRAQTGLRLRPKAGSELSSSLAAGTPVQTAGSTKNAEGNWLFVKAPRDSGWLRADELETTP